MWANSSRYIAPIWNEGYILSFGDDLSGGLIQKINPNLTSILFPSKTTIDILILIDFEVEATHIRKHESEFDKPR